ncbi:MAG: hypothetical protein WA679_00035, partial [Pseudolabrys sp.]
VPSLRKLANLDAVTGTRGQEGASANDQACIIIPVLTGTSFDRVANIAASSSFSSAARSRPATTRG